MADPFAASASVPVLQGWQAPGNLDLHATFQRAEGWALARIEAFPDPARLKARFQELAESVKGNARLGLDLRGLRDGADHVLAAAREAGVAFLLHTAELPPSLSLLKQANLPRIVAIQDAREAEAARSGGASALLADAALVPDLGTLHLPVLACAEDEVAARRAMASGAAGLQPRSPALLESEALASFRSRLDRALNSTDQELLRRGPAPLPRLRIRNLDLTYPIFQGGMGIGVSWDRLAGAVAREGCVGLVSAIGTGYHGTATSPWRLGRPDGSEALNPPRTLEGIVRSARERAGGRGAVGVNILCAIEGYEAAVRASVAGGAQLIVSGAGLPLALPEYVGEADVALVPIVSSARALGVICRHWQRRHGRLPDAVVLEGPESGGHQGFSPEACGDPAHTLEALLPSVLAERDQWGSFPVIVAG
ncbi:MAG TPA: nitronate monooxygenase, partial [Holophagaceae bacterium]